MNRFEEEQSTALLNYIAKHSGIAHNTKQKVNRKDGNIHHTYHCWSIPPLSKSPGATQLERRRIRNRIVPAPFGGFWDLGCTILLKQKRKRINTGGSNGKAGMFRARKR
jgi:hypothetical protein